MFLFIRRAGIDSIAAGETFYTHNLGIPELRHALAEYLSNLHKRTKADQVAVTNAGVNALMLATQLLVDPGERVVEVVPLWPNLQEIPKILGAQVETVALKCARTGWFLDLEKLIKALKPGTRALYLNSPNNLTGWTIGREEQRAILEHCRRHGVWIFADDAYERLYFGEGGVAPSFLDICEPEDRVVSTNTFSKTWLIEPVIARTLARFRSARDFLIKELNALEGIEAALPSGTMYAFFRVRGMRDSLEYCQHLVREVGLGLAPGSAFGPEGEGFLRWCFASSADRLADGISRLRRAMVRAEA